MAGWIPGQASARAVCWVPGRGAAHQCLSLTLVLLSPFFSLPLSLKINLKNLKNKIKFLAPSVSARVCSGGGFHGVYAGKLAGFYHVFSKRS